MVRINIKPEVEEARIVVVRIALALLEGIQRMMYLFKLSGYRTNPKYYAIKPVYAKAFKTKS